MRMHLWTPTKRDFTEAEIALMNAAPDLLEALQGMLADYEDDHGEGECDCRPEPENDGHVCNACLARAAIAKATKSTAQAGGE